MVLLQKIATTSDTIPLDVLAGRLAHDPDALRTRTQGVLARLDSLRTEPSLSDTASRDFVDRRVRYIGDALRYLATLNQSIISPATVNLEDSLARDFTYDLKHTYVVVEETGADVGDEISIVISNTSREHNLPRELHLRLRISQFGLIGRTSDSFL